MENTQGVFKMKVDCGRMGELEGIFVADKEHVKTLIESKIEVYFGEVLGKHSEICGSIEEKEIQLASDSPEAIKVINELNLESGYNPFCYPAMNYKHLGIEQEDDITVGEVIENLIELRSKKS